MSNKVLMGGFSSLLILVMASILSALSVASSVGVTGADDGHAYYWYTNNFTVVLQWPAKLQLIVYAGDGTRPLKGAWVIVVDAETGRNVTAAITDEQGYAGSLETSGAWGPLMTREGERLNLGLNLQRGVYIVKIYYKYGGAKDIYEPIGGALVFDTFRDQPQHRFIYLGVEPPETATGEDWRPAQERTINSNVWDMRLRVEVQTSVAVPISNATVKVLGHPEMPELETDTTGEVLWPLVPAGTYDLEVTVTSEYRDVKGDKAVAKGIVRVVVANGPAGVQVVMPVYDATLMLVSPSGRPIANAEVTVGGKLLGKTDTNGEVLAPLIPSGSFPVVVNWLGQDISPTEPLVVRGTRTYLVTASNVYTLQVRVEGEQGQGLSGAHVDIRLGEDQIFSGVANSDGVLTLELPAAKYNVTATYKGVTASQEVDLSADTVVTLKTKAFLELLGRGITFSEFVLCIILAVIVIILLVIIAQEYNIYRRKRLPQLFVPPPPGRSTR